MNVLFMTIGRMEEIEAHTLYCDLLRCFRDAGHNVYTISPYEKRLRKKSSFVENNGVHMLHVQTGNVTKSSSLIEKGFATISLETIFIKGIKKYLSNVKFDLVLYSTPPITFYRAIQYVKQRDKAKSYLLLKDIFPQNAVDLGMMAKNGPKGMIYKFFRAKERKLYAVSDRIGCMSQANVDYVLKHNPEVDPRKVEICPNAVEVLDRSVSEEDRREIRIKYGIPLDKKVFVYGGNLGKPQGIPFLIECLKSQEENGEVFFLIVGGGTEYGKLETYFQKAKPTNMKLMKQLPKDDYDKMVGACDVGMIFLDHRFTIPNFPSRLLAYMQAGLPVLACTDPNTDVGQVIVDGGFGWWCESDDSANFAKILETVNRTAIKEAGRCGQAYLKKNYTTEQAYAIIMQGLSDAAGM